MKFIALTYDYNLGKLSEIGRKWAFDVYKNKDFIFKYSAASYATFLDKNPNKLLHIYTDDINLMFEKMSEYNINQEKIKYIDYSENLKKYSNHLKYSFEILHDFIDYAKSDTDYTVKLDNDLIFHDEIPNIDLNGILVWKYERRVKDGDIRWGEIKICENTINETDFPIYNIGIFGFPVFFERNDVDELLHRMINVNISDVTDVGSNIYHCSEQTANNFIFYKYNYKITESYEFVTHHFDKKENCIKDAEYLKK